MNANGIAIPNAEEVGYNIVRLVTNSRKVQDVANNVRNEFTNSFVSAYIDEAIEILESLGYTYNSAVTGYRTVTDNNRYGIYGHTNGNTYTMVSPYPVAHPVIYIVRDKGIVTY